MIVKNPSCPLCPRFVVLGNDQNAGEAKKVSAEREKVREKLKKVGRERKKVREKPD